MLSAAQRGDLDPGSMTVQEQVSYVNNLRKDFPGIYDYYGDRYQPTWNHDMTAEHYIVIIADIIQEFDNFSLDRKEYEDVAWAGLRNLEGGTTSIAWNNLSDSEKQRILKNLSEHFFNDLQIVINEFQTSDYRYFNNYSILLWSSGAG